MKARLEEIERIREALITAYMYDIEVETQRLEIRLEELLRSDE